jgi:hypothetical protein
MSAAQIAKLIASKRYSFDSEDMLQELIGAVLLEAGIEATREVRINSKDRLDFLAGSVAIEVKIKGSRAEVLTQIHRYAQSERISAIVLVTTKPRHHGMPAELNGKEVHVASLLGGVFG